MSGQIPFSDFMRRTAASSMAVPEGGLLVDIFAGFRRREHRGGTCPWASGQSGDQSFAIGD
jgi:hypothetical protein